MFKYGVKILHQRIYPLSSCVQSMPLVLNRCCSSKEKLGDQTIFDGVRPIATGKKNILIVDTYKLTKELKDTGFTEEQAALLIDILVRVNSDVFDLLNRNLVSKANHEITTQQMLANLESLRKDMLIFEKSEFSGLKNDNEKLKMDMKLLKQSFSEEVERVSNSIRLDLNLEKSRAREEHNKIQAEIIKTQNRIDTSSANLRTAFEQYRNDMFKYAAATVLSCLGIVLSFWRIWK